MSPADFEHLGGDTVWEGRIARVRVERYRHADGEKVTREVIRHPGAVVVVAHDDHELWLVRQPREVVGEGALLELPAGKLDVPGEPALATAQRELAEEVGLAAARWEHVTDFWTSPGFTDERIALYLATGLSLAENGAGHSAEEDERIEIVRWPLAGLDETIDRCEDAKSLIGLLWLRRRSAASG